MTTPKDKQKEDEILSPTHVAPKQPHPSKPVEPEQPIQPGTREPQPPTGPTPTPR